MGTESTALGGVRRQRLRCGRLDLPVGLSDYAGKTVKLELVNQPNGWSWEAGYWAKIAIESE